MKRKRPLKLNNSIKLLYRHSKRNSKYKIPYSKSSLEQKNQSYKFIFDKYWRGFYNRIVREMCGGIL